MGGRCLGTLPFGTDTISDGLIHDKLCSSQAGGEAGSKIMTDAIAEVQGMPSLKHVDFAKYRQLLQGWFGLACKIHLARVVFLGGACWDVS